MLMTRRLFLPLATAGALASHRALAQSPAEILRGEGYAAMSLRDALSKRESIRMYSDAPIEDEQLHALLWAANGINRNDVGGRTAPSWRASKDTEIYVAQSSGVDHFDAAENRLVPFGANDIRAIASPQPFVGTAPVVLIYVSERSRVLDAAGLDEQAFDQETEDHRIAAHVNAAMISQNVYLFCAAEGLGTCLVGGADRSAIADALNLSDAQRVTYVQPVGHPADRRL